jgi:hypothetical protein
MKKLLLSLLAVVPLFLAGCASSTPRNQAFFVGTNIYLPGSIVLPQGVITAPPQGIMFSGGGGGSPFIQILQEPEDVLVRLGDPAQFSVQIATQMVTFQWRFQGTNVPGATNSTLAFGSVNTNQLGEYECLISTEIETKKTQSVTLAGYFDNGPGITLIAFPPVTPPGYNNGLCPFPSVGKMRFPAGTTTYVVKTPSLPANQYVARDLARTDTKIFCQGNYFLDRTCGITPVTVSTGISTQFVFMLHFPHSPPTAVTVPYYLELEGFVAP